MSVDVPPITSVDVPPITSGLAQQIVCEKLDPQSQYLRPARQIIADAAPIPLPPTPRNAMTKHQLAIFDTLARQHAALVDNADHIGVFIEKGNHLLATLNCDEDVSRHTQRVQALRETVSQVKNAINEKKDQLQRSNEEYESTWNTKRTLLCNANIEVQLESVKDRIFRLKLENQQKESESAMLARQITDLKAENSVYRETSIEKYEEEFMHWSYLYNSKMKHYLSQLFTFNSLSSNLKKTYIRFLINKMIGNMLHKKISKVNCEVLSLTNMHTFEQTAMAKKKNDLQEELNQIERAADCRRSEVETRTAKLYQEHYERLDSLKLLIARKTEQLEFLEYRKDDLMKELSRINELNIEIQSAIDLCRRMRNTNQCIICCREVGDRVLMWGSKASEFLYSIDTAPREIQGLIHQYLSKVNSIIIGGGFQSIDEVKEKYGEEVYESVVALQIRQQVENIILMLNAKLEREKLVHTKLVENVRNNGVIYLRDNFTFNFANSSFNYAFCKGDKPSSLPSTPAK